MAKKGPARREERRTYWQTAIDLQRESRLSIRQFCRQEGLAESAFYVWRRELQRSTESSLKSSTPKASTSSSPNFVPVEIKPTSHQSTSSAPLVIELASGTRLNIAEGCSPELLRTTLELLRC